MVVDIMHTCNLLLTQLKLFIICENITIMKKYFLIITVFLYFGSAIAGGHLSNKDKKATLECTGL